MSCAAAREQLPRAAPCADLQEFPAKNVIERFAQQVRFCAQETCAERRLPPGLQGRVSVGQEISGKEALIMGIAQRSMNTPYPEQAPGPNVPTTSQ